MAKASIRNTSTPKTKAKAKETKPKETKEKAPELDWDRIEEGNPKDARLHGSPCHGSHQIKTRSNQHAMWQWCERCGVRLCYVPRVGKTGLHRAAGPLAADVQSITYEVSQAEELAYNPRLKDQAIGLQAAENSALRQLETHQGAEGEGDPEECGSGNEAELPDGLGQGFGSDPERSGAFLAYGASRSGGCGPGSSHTGRSGEPSCEPGEQATPGEPNREPGVRSEDWGGQVMSSEDQDVKSLESLAQGLCDRQAFSFADCDRLLHQLATVGAAWNRSRRLPLDEKKSGGYLTFGLFSHGNMHGLTRKTHDFPFLCRYLNLFGKFHLKEHGAHWTSFSVSVNQAVNLHLDGHNSPGSSNYTCSFGQFDGGQLWVELTEGCNSLSSPVRWKTKRNGQRVPGHLHSTRHRFVQFDPKSFHATDRWTGLRISLTFYTSRLIAQSDETTRTSLRRFGFPIA